MVCLYKIRSTAVGVAALVIGASGANAQTGKTAAVAPAQNEEIVVTAQKREQLLQDVPVAIQAFSGESLERTGIKSAADVILQVPSASFQSSTPTQSVLQLRGISQNAAVDPSVAFYVDEIPLGFPGSPFIPNVDALDLARIEVLRGPQGTLYGLGAMGGTVRVITSDPSYSEGFSGRFLLEGSSMKGGDNSYTGSAALNVPLVADKLAARVTVSRRHLGGWIDDSGRGTKNINDDDTLSVRAKLLFTPSDQFKVKLTYWRNEVDTKWNPIAFFKNTTVKTATGTTADPEAFQNTHFDIGSAFVSYDLGFATIENGLSYYKSNTPARFVIGLGAGATLVVDTLERAKALTNELRLVSQGNTPFQWIVGTFYRDAKRDFLLGGGIGALPLFPFTNTVADSESISVFGEASYGFADDKLRVLVGARYFEDQRHVTEIVRDTGAVLTDLDPKFHSFNPRLNITYKPKDDVMIYFNGAKGFRSGIIANSAQRISAAIDGIFGIEVVDPDSIWTYEIGTKLTLFDRKLFLDATVFYSDWKNFQYAAASTTGFQFNVNGGDARIKGVEGSLTWRTPVKGLSAVLSGSYTDAKFRTVRPIVSANSAAFVPGARLPSVPRWSGSLAVNYDAPIGGSGLNLVAGTLYTFRDGQPDGAGLLAADGSRATFTDSRDELSLRAGVRKGEWELTAFMNNVTNNLTSINSLNNTQWTSPTPRTIGLRLTGGF